MLISHRSLSNYLDWCSSAYPSDGSGAVLHSSLAFDLAVTSLFAPLATGGATELVDAEGPESLAEVLRRRPDLSFLKLTPSHLRLLDHQLGQDELSSVARALIVGGEAVHGADLASWRRSAPETSVFNEYGPTEATVGCCVARYEAGTVPDEPLSIGRPIEGTRAYVLDPARELVPAGVVGELHLAGAGLARGYQGRPALTAASFLPDPFSSEPGQRMYRSGDLARLVPGKGLEYLGRIDDQVKIRGFRVEVGEVDAALAAAAGVARAAVMARKDEAGETRLVGYYVPEPGAEVTVDGLRSSLEERLPAFMVPSAFVELETLPLGPSGKVDKAALPAPGGGRPALQDAYQAPAGQEEEVLAGVWAQVLGIERVGRDDNYFALGGDSIRSIQVVARSQERGFEFSVDDLFRYPTIRELAGALREDSTGESELREIPPSSLLPEASRSRLPEDAEDAYPLTMLQAGMIFHRELEPGSPIYHDISSFHVGAPLDLGLLRLAIEEMVARHAALRTSFDMTGFDEPIQVVHRDGVVVCPVDDLTGLSPDEQERAIDEFFEAEKAVGFDPALLPLIRFRVHVRGDDDWQFTLSFHHAILDGWSEATMITEMFHHYLSLCRGEPRVVEPPAASFASYVALERRALEAPETEAFWDEVLRGTSFLRVPRAEAPPPAPDGRREILIVEAPFSNQVSEGLKRLALTLAVPIKDVLLAAHMRVMSLLAGRPDVLTCIVSAGRPEGPDGDRAVGLFINSMPFRMHLDGGSWEELVTDTFATERRALPHRRYPMAKLKANNGGRALSETLFYFTHYHVYQSLEQIPDVEVRGARLYEETSFVVAANFRVDPFTSRVHFVLKCDGTELTRTQVERIGDYYVRVLERMAADPAERYERADLLSGPERDQLLLEWSGGGAVAPTGGAATIHEICLAEADRHPHRVALTDGGTSLTYGELGRRARSLAERLRGHGVGPEVRVGICLPRSLDLPVAILAVLEAGGAYVPLDPDYPRERLGFLLEDSRAEIVLTRTELVSVLPEGSAALAMDGDSPRPDGGEASAVRRPAAVPDNLAYVIYTSGSTGRPKGSLVSHRNVARLFDATSGWLEAGPTDTWTLFHSYAFDFSVWEMWGALLHGGRVVVVPFSVSRNPEAFHDLLERERVTVLSQTPSAFRQLADVEERGGAGDLPLRLVVFGGEALDFAALGSWFDRHGEGPRMVNMYGITETTVHVTYRPIAAAEARTGAASAVGAPLPDLRVYLLDPYGLPVAAGVPGEIFVGGAGLARGYLGRPALTAERFLPDPFSGTPGARLYRTGDAARFAPGGDLVHLGRLDQQVKIRGFRIELGEIEAFLAEHPAVSEAVVLAREAGPGERRLTAYYVLGPGEEARAAELRGHLAERLPDYMVPAHYVALDQLPLTANGKLDRDALPEPEWDRPDLESEYVAPRTSEEEILAGSGPRPCVSTGWALGTTSSSSAGTR